MKLHKTFLLFCFILSGCAESTKDTTGDFRTAQERMQEDRNGSLFGKDALGWKWSKNADEKTIISDDHLWSATSRVMAEYPISFNNFHARIMQTDWIFPTENSDTRYRFTVRLLGKEPKANNLDVLMMAEKKQGATWTPSVPNTAIRNSLIDKILIEATRLYDQAKRD